MKYHYFYKIINNINNHFYYGVHNTDNLEDGYMGSGKLLHMAYKKYGINNFTKEILKFFPTSDEAFDYEKNIVNKELVNNPDCYNISLGGKNFNTKNMVIAKDVDNNVFLVKKEEFIYNDNLFGLWKGKHHKQESRDQTRVKMTPDNSKNPRIWINKDGKVKYLLKTKLNEYLTNGWTLGRVNYKPRKNKQGVLLESGR